VTEFDLDPILDDLGLPTKGPEVSGLLCVVCIVHRGVTLRDILPDQTALKAHIEIEHEPAETIGAAGLRRYLHGNFGTDA
jgi:hypothetical protein